MRVGQAESPAKTAFEDLAEHHLESSYRLARAILHDDADAEDATHDAFVKAWQHWHELRDPAHVEQWLARIVVNTCRSWLRQAARRNVRNIGPEIAVAVDDIGLADTRATLGRAFSALSPDHRVAVALRYYRDLTADQIAELLGIPVGTVHSRLHYAVKQMGSALSRNETEIDR